MAAAVIVLLPVAALAVPKTGQPLPPFDVTTSSGQRVVNQNYSGRVLLLTFSTDYCSACKKAVPQISDLAGRLGRDGFHVLGLFSGFGMDNDDLKEYIKTYGVTYPMALVEQRLTEETFGAISVPYFLLVNKKGAVVAMYRGVSDLTMKQIETQARKLLAE
jgi:thiol-disulfide isomerase/thioredoxin